jgi:hypothetical protein
MTRSGLDQWLSALDQNRGSPRSVLCPAVTPPAVPATCALRRGRTLRGASLGVAGFALALLLIPFAAGTPVQTPSWSTAGSSWTNGVVQCDFSGTLPSTTVGALSLPGTGMAVQLGAMEEVTPTGMVVTEASMANATWSVENLSTPSVFDLTYVASVPIEPRGSEGATGTVAMAVHFLLPAYTEDTNVNLSLVTVSITASNWSWTYPTDQLALVFPLAPVDPSSEHLAAPAAGNSSLESRSVSTGALMEVFSPAATASIGPSGELARSTVATPSYSVQPTAGSATVLIGTGSTGTYSALAYVAQVGIVLPATIAGIPLYEYVVVGTLAGVIAVVVGVGTRRLRGRPSDLTYVDEEP